MLSLTVTGSIEQAVDAASARGIFGAAYASGLMASTIIVAEEYQSRVNKWWEEHFSHIVPQPGHAGVLILWKDIDSFGTN